MNTVLIALGFTLLIMVGIVLFTYLMVKLSEIKNGGYYVFGVLSLLMFIVVYLEMLIE